MINEKLINKVKNIEEINMENSFFHYTDSKNLQSIFCNGLEPRIGKNSKGIEKSEKVFFSIGHIGVLVLMDAWIKWLVLRPTNNFIYQAGAFLMTKPYFPKVIIDCIFKTWIKDEKRINKACKKLKTILDNSVFLVLDLEQGTDYDFKDVDEVKSQKFSRKSLSYIYTYGQNLDNNAMEYWNMHTFSNKIIEKDKISLLKIENQFSANYIIRYMVEKSNIDIKEKLPFLYQYLIYNGQVKTT